MAIRLDKFLTKSYPQYSRNKLNQYVCAGYVFVNDKIETKPSYLVNDNDKVELKLKKDDMWVSRGAYKLLKALEEYHIDLNDKVCLDIGCSTGGFTQVMLRHGAKNVYALDVGTNQFDKSLLNNKVVLMEQTHFCRTKATDFEHIDFIACDVSFISATKIIEHVARIFNYPITFVCLIKPQFELTKQILDKCKGSIPEKYHQQAISSVCSCATKCGFNVSNIIASPILGAKSSNKEFLVCLRRV